MKTDILSRLRKRFLRVVVAKPTRLSLWLLVAFLGSMLKTSGPAYGAEISKYPENPYYAGAREIALLPRYCVHTQLYRDRVPGGGDQGQIGRWESLLGGMFQHMHHYCAGLVLTNRALLLSVGRQKFDLAASIVEFNYVIERAPPEFVLLPEILTKKGENLLQLDKATDGVAALLRAIQLKPDYWPPYAVLSYYFKKLNNVSVAREWIEKGLAAAPHAKALQRRQFELGGTKSK